MFACPEKRGRVNGGKEVVDAVQAGKDSAKAILEYVQGNEK